MTALGPIVDSKVIYSDFVAEVDLETKQKKARVIEHSF